MGGGRDLRERVAAARRIIELEQYPVSAVFFELLIETKAGSEEEAFAHLEHTGGERSAVMSSSVYEIRARRTSPPRPL
jgi:hypothetical protein